MLFEKDHRHGSTAKQRRYARFEIAYTFADFGAAFSFIVGSIFFFFEPLMTAGTWLFLFGSVLFAAKPSIRLIREIKLAAMGDDDILQNAIRIECDCVLRAAFRSHLIRSGSAMVRQGLNPEAIFAIAMDKPDDFAKGR